MYLEIDSFFGVESVFLLEQELGVIFVNLEYFFKLFLVNLGLVLQFFFVLLKRLYGIQSGMVSLSAVEMSFGKFVEILRLLLDFEFILVEGFTFVVFLDSEENIAVVLDFVHFLDAKPVVGQHASLSVGQFLLILLIQIENSSILQEHSTDLVGSLVWPDNFGDSVNVQGVEQNFFLSLKLTRRDGVLCQIDITMIKSSQIVR